MSDSVEVQIARLQEQAIQAKVALEIARKEIERRLEDMNRFREENRGDNAKFATILNMESKFDAINSRVNTFTEALRLRLEIIEKKESNMDGRFWMLGAGLSALVVISGLVFKFLIK